MIIRWGLIGPVVACALNLGLAGAASAQSLPGSTRDLAMNSYNNAFYVVSNGSGYYKNTTSGGVPDRGHFWQYAEQIEMIEDAYDRTGNSVYKTMVSQLCNGFISVNGNDWTWNGYNDDLLWASIAFSRASKITGNTVYATYARNSFDAVWSRAYDTQLGGGLWWTTAKTCKNACDNGPAMIAALYLYQNGSGSSYLTKAQNVYTWLKSKLYDANSGRVADHINADGSVDWSFWTYNQGTFIGAAALLYTATSGSSTYYADGRLALLKTKTDLTGQHVAGILNDEYTSSGGGGDSPGFKGIFARWAARWIKATGDTEFNSWLQQNANAAWTYRNSSGITWAQWWQRTPDSGVTSWECTSAAVITQVSP